MLVAIMVGRIMLRFIMLSVIMLGFIVLSVIMIDAIVLCHYADCFDTKRHNAKCHCVMSCG